MNDPNNDRASPHSIEFERALLGGVIVNPERLREAAEYVAADDFFRTSHQLLFSLLLDMHGKNEPIDGVTLPERVSRDGRIESFGGHTYILTLIEEGSATTNLVHYAQTIREKSVLRQFIEGSRSLVDRAFAQSEPSARLLEDTVASAMKLGGGAASRKWERISEIIDREMRKIEERSKSPQGVVGLTTGFSGLDKLLAGLHGGDLLILAARPSMGKTALALNIAQNAAMIDRRPVAVFSLEMGREALVSRMLSTQGLVPAEKMRTGNLNESEWSKLVEADTELRKAPIHIDDTPALTLGQIRARCQRLKAQEGDLALIVLDYLQLMSSDDGRASRQEQVSELSRGLKGIARDLNVPVLALSQLSRAVEQRADKRPMLSDLRESGAIEQDADVIMFIYRDEYYNKETTEKKGLAEVIIAKQRNGAVGTVNLAFQAQYTRFDEVDSQDGLDV